MTKNTLTRTLLVAILSGLTACTAPPARTGSQLSVSVGIRESVPSKAEPSSFVDGTVNRTIAPGKSFGLYAWEGSAPAGKASFMDNVRVTNEGGAPEGVFTYYPVRYWPDGGRQLSMQAYYPYSDGFSASGVIPLQTDGPASYSFTMNADASSQTDFMVSDILSGLRQEGPSRPVQITLRHALAQLALDAGMPDGVSVERVEMTGIATQGILTQTAAGNTTADSWELLPSTETITSGADGRSGTFLVIPQAVTTAQRIRLTWSYDDGTGIPTSHTDEASLLSAGITGWNAGQTYTYHLRLATSGLSLTASVSDWQKTVKVMDYTTEITIRNDGRIRWTAGTYDEKDDSSHTLQLGYRQEAVNTFAIDTPTGAVWKAVFRTDEGAVGAFEFVDGEGNGHSTINGDVGEPATLRIRATDDRPAQVNSAYLSIYVEAAGVNRHVTTLVDDLGSEWKIVQDRNV